MSAAARAEARRKAILSRGTDRLAKLTTSARGEDHPVYIHDDPPLPKLGKVSLESFVGEENSIPSPAPSIPITTQELPPDQIAFLSNLQETVNAFSQTNVNVHRNGTEDLALGSNAEALSDDPLATMISQLTQQGFNPSAFQQVPSSGITPAPAQKTAMQKVLPLLYLLATWAMLSYFVVIWEPQVYESVLHDLSHDSLWSRWSELNWREAKGKIGVQTAPIFWAFTTLQLALHSTALFTKSSIFRPPALLSMILLSLPQHISSWVTRCLSYWQLAGIFLDNLAALIFGVGVLIWIATCMT